MPCITDAVRNEPDRTKGKDVMTYWIAPENDPDIAARGTTLYGGGQLSADDIEVACAGLFVVNAQHFADKDAV